MNSPAEMAPPADYRSAAATGQAQTLADAPWFQVFDDPALQALIKEAIAANLDLRIALSRVEEARARAGIAPHDADWAQSLLNPA